MLKYEARNLVQKLKVLAELLSKSSVEVNWEVMVRSPSAGDKEEALLIWEGLSYAAMQSARMSVKLAPQLELDREDGRISPIKSWVSGRTSSSTRSETISSQRARRSSTS